MNRSTKTLLIAVVGAVALIPMGVLVFARSASAPAQAADVAVSCGAGFRAEVRQTMAGGTPRIAFDCVFDPTSQGASFTQPWPTSGGAMMPALVPAAYTVPAAAPAARASSPAVRQISETRVVAPSRKKTSWQRHAIVIGGSAGAGAGIGALAGGKKGALIGAAIGGGGAALVQAARNR